MDQAAGQRAETRSRMRGVIPASDAGQDRPAAPPQVGRYQVLGVIGRGAMGVVYKARDPLLDRVVAIKTIHASAALGSRVRRSYLERFEREAKAAARIAHPATVTIFDVGLEADSPFLVMEYLPGETLADRLDRERMPLPEVYECARELASALGVAHRLRIVHRDVKPANVLHAGGTYWKLGDFGIARLPDSDLTQVGTFMGTPGYAPPEAIREGRYTAQADVFAWGALFYELLTGRIPYEGPDTETTNKKVVAGEPPSPVTVDPTVPPGLAAVAERALAHDPKRRFADGTAVAEALIDAWGRSVAAGQVPLAAFAASAQGHAVTLAQMLRAGATSAGISEDATGPGGDDGDDTQVDLRSPGVAAAVIREVPPRGEGGPAHDAAPGKARAAGTLPATTSTRRTGPELAQGTGGAGTTRTTGARTALAGDPARSPEPAPPATDLRFWKMLALGLLVALSVCLILLVTSKGT